MPPGRAPIKKAWIVIARSNNLPMAIAWDLANEYPATSLPGEGDHEFARRVADATSGLLRIRPRCDAETGFTSRRQFDAVSRGELALADSFSGALTDVHAMFQLSSLPFLTADASEAQRLFELAQPHYARVLEGLGQKLLYASPWPPTGLWSRQPVADAASMQGLRVRTYDRASAGVFTRLGAAGTHMSFADALPRLAAGELDAVLSSGDGGAGDRLWQQLPVFTPLVYAVPLSFTTMHLPTWEALDNAFRLALEHAAAATMQSQWRRMQGRVEENAVRLRAHGATVAPPVCAAFRAQLEHAADGAVTDWLARAGAEGRALLGAFRGAEWVHSRISSKATSP
jgi:TRAP-type C4-dicarboxylate transport system substrate-binding protein